MSTQPYSQPDFKHPEHHRSHRSSWLRAAVLGANDGIVSVAALLLGVLAAGATLQVLVSVGLAALIAGAMSMAAGEYVSVKTQADTTEADLHQEREALTSNYEAEVHELARIYQSRGLEPALAEQVARQLMQHNALEAHARDEIGLTDLSLPNPLQAAFVSAAAFSAGAVLPLAAALLTPWQYKTWVVATASIAALAVLGSVSAHAGGAPLLRPTLRVVVWGALAMSLTLVAGSLVGHFG